MFQISAAQEEALFLAVRGPFHRRAAAVAREALPEQTDGMIDSDLIRRVAEADRRALAIDLETERGTTQFICYDLTVGPGFADLPEVQAYFAVSRSDPDSKMQFLVDEVVRRKRAGGHRGSTLREAAEAGARALGVLLGILLAPVMLGSAAILGPALLTGGAAAAETAEAGAPVAAALGPAGTVALGVAAVAVGAVAAYRAYHMIQKSTAGVPPVHMPKPVHRCPPKRNTPAKETPDSDETVSPEPTEVLPEQPTGAETPDNVNPTNPAGTGSGKGQRREGPRMCARCGLRPAGPLGFCPKCSVR